jgi:hypothetical protein
VASITVRGSEGQDDREAWGKCAAEAVQGPDEEASARRDRGEGLRGPWMVVPHVAGLVGTQVPGIHAGRAQRMTWHVRRPGLGLTGDPDGAHPHRRETPYGTLSHIPSIR